MINTEAIIEEDELSDTDGSANAAKAKVLGGVGAPLEERKE